MWVCGATVGAGVAAAGVVAGQGGGRDAPRSHCGVAATLDAGWLRAACATGTARARGGRSADVQSRS